MLYVSFPHLIELEHFLEAMLGLGYYIGWIENQRLDMVSPLSTSHIVEYKFQPLISLC